MARTEQQKAQHQLHQLPDIQHSSQFLPSSKNNASGSGNNFSLLIDKSGPFLAGQKRHHHQKTAS